MHETWTLIGRKDDEVMVMRDLDGRKTVYTLRPYKGSWRVFIIRFSKVNPGANCTPERTKVYMGVCDPKLCWDKTAHKHGIRLSGSRLDRTLLDYCEGRRA